MAEYSGGGGINEGRSDRSEWRQPFSASSSAASSREGGAAGRRFTSSSGSPMEGNSEFSASGRGAHNHVRGTSTGRSGRGRLYSYGHDAVAKRSHDGNYWEPREADGELNSEERRGRGRGQGGRGRGRGRGGRGRFESSGGRMLLPAAGDWSATRAERGGGFSSKGRGDRGGHSSKGATNVHGGSHEEQYHERRKHIPVEEKEKWIPTTLNVRDLKMLLASRDVVSKIFTRVKSFQHTLSNQRLLDQRGMMEAVIETLSTLVAKVEHNLSCSKDKQGEAIQVLAEVLSDRCSLFHMCLKKYVMTTGHRQDWKLLAQVSKLFKSLLIVLPGSSWSCLPVDELQDVIVRQKESMCVFRTHIPDALVTDVKDIIELRNKLREQFSVHKQSTKYESIEWDNSEYRSIQILPKWEELCIRDLRSRLRPNVIQGGYKNWMHYYDVQFRLLREDFIAPLRRGVCDILSGERGRKLTDVKVYHSVRIGKPLFTSSGICFQVQFDVGRFKHYQWDHSKRLLYGSLLCFFLPGNSQESAFLATVANREVKNLKKGVIQVHFENITDVAQYCNRNITFTMVESVAYFEASRHILRSLQTAEVDTMPFTKYLIIGDHCTEVDVPKYIEGSGSTSSVYNLKCLKKEEESSFGLTFDVLDKVQWSSASMVELDASQLKAIQMALTQEIAVIQGPPGTGKTYIGIKIVEALLGNRRVWDPNSESPILVMCYTNHALDQFLEGILDIDIADNDKSHVFPPPKSQTKKPKIVRIGGGCKNEKIEPLNIKEVRCKIRIPQPYFDVRSESFKGLRKLSEKNLWSKVQYFNKCMLLSVAQVRAVADPDHYYWLSQFSNAKDEEEYALEIWLGLWNNDITDENTPQVYNVEQVEEISEAHQQEDEHTNNEQEDEQTNTENSETYQQEDEISEDGSEELENEDEELIDIIGDAVLEEDARMIGDDHFVVFNSSAKQLNGVQDKCKGKQGPSNDNNYEENEDEVLMKKKPLTTSTVERKGGPRVKKTLRGRRPDFSHFIWQHISQKAMTDERAEEVTDFAKLSLKNRWSLHNNWVAKYHQNLLNENCKHLQEYTDACERHRSIHQEIDRFALETADVIGMTTTGAAKYQHIIHLVKPKIVIVEEAAEVLESHIVSALNAGTQHLILIGDHKQLRPKPNEYNLAKKYNLEVSLFERLVLLNLPSATLEIQHRMRPEIAQLVHPHIYSTLINHESVLEYENITGASKNMFFIQHEFPEETDENLVSHSNLLEANFIPALCRYFLQQGYEPSQITIITPYTGQLLRIRKNMPKAEFFGVRVTAIDNFQGEENDIILLSLVRSNSEGNIGFLKEPNRVCVALSRAKKGFYCIGNFKLLRNQAPIWEQIMSDMEKKGYVGDGIPLYCKNHPETTFLASSPEDFKKHAPTGGCNLPCSFRLSCGHVCAKTCHILNPKHIKFKCQEPCADTCNQGHPCHNLCYEACSPSKDIKKEISTCGHTQDIRKKISTCGHIQGMRCSMDPEFFYCKAPCAKKCKEGHPLCHSSLCHEPCPPCSVMVERELPSCGHRWKMRCFKDPATYICNILCSKKMPECGHVQQALCHELKSLKCKEPCERMCKNKHPCHRPCFEKCKCEYLVEVKMPICHHIQKVPCHKTNFQCEFQCEKKCKNGHSQLMSCHVDPVKWPCKFPCEKLLHCGLHTCNRVCSDPCPEECTEFVEAELRCGHKVLVECYKKLYEVNCIQKCTKMLPCGHECEMKCSAPCTRKCFVNVKEKLPCGHVFHGKCFIRHNYKFKCQEKCLKLLDCGHTCSKKCCEDYVCFKPVRRKYPCGHTQFVPCSSNFSSHPCEEHIERKYPCGHTQFVPCSSNFSSHPCEEKCNVLLSCGHRCSGNCSSCYETRIHPLCKFDIKLNRYCGHTVSTPCRGLTDTCNMEYSIPCAHDNPVLKCPDLPVPCKKPCKWNCPHHRCSKLCHEICDRPPCDKRCIGKLHCGHQCPGVCGEPCLTVCPECEPQKFKPLLQDIKLGKKSKIPKDVLYIQLHCSHIFPVQYLDQHVFPGPVILPDSSSCVRLRKCPVRSCKGYIGTSYRYGNVVKECLMDVMQIKQKVSTESSDRCDTKLLKDAVELLRKSWLLQPRNAQRVKEKIFEICASFETEPDSLDFQMFSACIFNLATIFSAAALMTGVFDPISSSTNEVFHLITKYVSMAVHSKDRIGNTRQLLTDVISEQNRIFLKEQCSIADMNKRCQILHLEKVQHYLQHLEENHMHNERVSLKDLAKYSQLLERYTFCTSASELIPLDSVERFSKGEWYKCQRGHLFCKPPLLDMCCPNRKD